MFPFLATQRARIIAGAVVAVLLLAIGYGVGLLTRPGTPGDGSPEAGFARDMSTHHAQAVEMGMIAYQKATCPTCGPSAATSRSLSRARSAS